MQTGLTIQLHDGDASTEPTVTVTASGGSSGSGPQMALRLKLTILEDAGGSGWRPVHSLEKSFSLGKRGVRRKDEANFEVVWTNWNRVASLDHASPVKILCVVLAKPRSLAPLSPPAG